jgi:TRAP-type C4-dicarboxylate transport system substrate-binding protein
MATALRTRQFNNTAAALDSVGASSIVRNGKLDLPASYEVVRRFIQTMAQPKAAELMVEGQYEIAGMFPLGAAYAFMRDRSMASLDELVGKRVGTFDHDKAQAELVQKLGARPVSVDINNVGPTFNNGNVDMVAVPTVAYKPFELFRGVGTKGGVLRFPLTISTYQMVIRSAKYPAGFGQQSREYIARNFDLAMATLKLADRGIPENQWVDLTPADSERYQKTIKQVRIQMAENGYYDKKGLKLIKKIRCSMNGEAAECTDGTEAW